jgi:hypothetical protein
MAYLSFNLTATTAEGLLLSSWLCWLPSARGHLMQQIADRLEKLDMAEYAQRFAENDIDCCVLPHFDRSGPKGSLAFRSVIDGNCLRRFLSLVLSLNRRQG